MNAKLKAEADMRNTIDDDISEQTDKNSGDYRSNQSKTPVAKRSVTLLFITVSSWMTDSG
ncbi:hypothetical protein PO124_08280 [Bacillus licheniformis]|nr:hypothetical protein [Bacillus licheniformis]